MSQGGSHSDFDNELERVEGPLPAAERNQWWIGPVVVLAVIAVVTIVLLVRGVL